MVEGILKRISEFLSYPFRSEGQVDAEPPKEEIKKEEVTR